MKKIQNFIKTAGAYFVGSVLSKLISFFLLPLYTNYLKPDVMGAYDYAVTILSFAAPICFFQIWDAMFRFSFDYEDDKHKQIVISNAYIVTFIGLIIYSLVFTAINHFVCFDYVFLVYTYGLFLAINYLYSYLARVYRRNMLFSISGFLNSLVVAITNIVLILQFGMGLKSLYISSILGAIVQCLIIEAYLHTLSNISIKSYDKKLIISMIKFSMPLCIATVSYWLLSGYTKVIIVNKLGNEENGLYSVTNKFAMFLNMVVSIFQFAWNEMAYISNKDKNRNSMYALATEYIIHFVIMSACALMIFSKMIFPYIVGNSYQIAVVLLPASIIGVAFNSIAGFLGTIFSAEKKTNYIFWTTVVAAAVNCLLGLFFTNIYKLQGAIVALAISFGVLCLLRIVFIIRKLFVRVRFKSFIALAWLGVSTIFFYINNNPIASFAFIIMLLIFELIYNRTLIVKLLRTIRKR